MAKSVGRRKYSTIFPYRFPNTEREGWCFLPRKSFITNPVIPLLGGAWKKAKELGILKTPYNRELRSYPQVFEHIHPLKFNSSPLKNDGTGRRSILVGARSILRGKLAVLHVQGVVVFLSLTSHTRSVPTNL